MQNKQRVEYVAAIAGHEQQYKITMGVYSQAISPAILKEVVDVVAY